MENLVESGDDSPETLNWEFASPGQRVGAWLVDGFLALVTFSAVAAAVVAAMSVWYVPNEGPRDVGFEEFEALYFGLTAGFIGTFGLQLVLLRKTARNGLTVGKRFVKIRVVSVDGGGLVPRRIVKREFLSKFVILLALTLGTVGWWWMSSAIDKPLLFLSHFNWIGVVWLVVSYMRILVDSNNQSFHDKIAGTYVVKA